VPLHEKAEFELSMAESLVLRPLGHGLLVSYVVDEGERFGYVQQRHIDAADLSREELHRTALENLRAIAKEQLEVRKYGNVYAALMGGSFEASLILLNEFWSEWYSELAPSGFVAVFPARDILAFGDAESLEARRELMAICERAEGKVDHPLSSALFQRLGEGCQPLGG
jgi:uncharacterized protein YtpQ (UPF0354 family)